MKKPIQQMSFMKKTATVLCLSVLFISCEEAQNLNQLNEELSLLQMEVDSLYKAQESSDSALQMATFFTFQNQNAEEAMNFYLDLFEDSKVVEVKRWGKDMPSPEGTIMHATFELNGKLFMCSDSPAVHEWGFTPAVSNYVDCTDENQLQDLFNRLSENGKVMMPLDNYGFSQKFGFVEDRFGVSWQLNLK